MAEPELPAAVPAELGVVIARCLAKEPGGRYQQSGEVRAALEGRESVRGEITVLIGKSDKPAASTETVEEAVRRLEAEGMMRMDAIKAVARERRLPKREVYKLFERD